MRRREPRLHRLIASLAVFALVVPLWAVAAGRDEGGSRQRIAVLLLGNSMTHYNALPMRLAERLRAARPDADVHVAALAPDGESLAGHLAGDAFRRSLAERSWDYVVLQERTHASTWTLDGEVHYDPPERYLADVGAIVALVRAHGAQPVLYQTWSPSAPEDGFAYVDYATVEAARAHGARLAPAGRVWRALKAEGLPMTLTDGVHPTPLASHAAAASIAAALIGEDALEDHGQGPPTEGQAAEPAPPDAAKEHAQALAAVRSAYRSLAATDGGPPSPVPRPEYAQRPAPGRSDVPLRGQLSGIWRARDGGTRLSHGTELGLAVDAERCEATLREYTASGVLAPQVRVQRCDDERLELEFTSSAVEFRLIAWMEQGALSVLTLQGNDRTRMQYRRVRYVRDHARDRDAEAVYFDALRGIYLRLEQDTLRRGLAEALRAHHLRLRALLGEERLVGDRQGFPLNEWDLILAAWHYTAIGDSDQALVRYAAGAALYPGSVDLHVSYGDALARMGRNSAAAVAYDAALALLDPQRDAARRRALEAKRKALGAP